MARPKLTEEQKKERDAQRKIERKAAKEAERKAKWDAQRAIWDAQAQESRDRILATLPEEFKARFLKVVEAVNTQKTTNSFIVDVVAKWNRFGNLSEKQMNMIIESYERDRQRVSVAETIEEFFVVGEKTLFKNLEIISVKTVPVEGVFNGWTTKIQLKNRSGIFFSIKTNAEKFINLFKDALEAHRKVNVNATIKWHFPDSDTVILTSRGLKVEVNV
jgi:hypothetical protein